MAFGDPPNSSASVCPNCGHCPTCGRNAAPYWPWPWAQPYWYYSPTIYSSGTFGEVAVGHTTAVGNTHAWNATVTGGNSAQC